MLNHFRIVFALLVVTVGIPAISHAETLSPKLVICGGGSLPSSIFERFRSLAGPQPRLIYIPTASQRKVDEQQLRELWKTRGFDQVTILHSDNRDVTSSEAFSEPLKTATAVWFGGGSQQRIANAYLDTPVEKELYNLLERGGVIGGTSAGAAIQSRVMIASGRSEPKISKGLNLLEQSIIDQHFLQRNRITRLMVAVNQHHDRTGFGIDESTAIVVNGDQAEVVGKSYVLRVQWSVGKLQLDSFGNGEKIKL